MSGTGTVKSNVNTQKMGEASASSTTSGTSATTVKTVTPDDIMKDLADMNAKAQEQGFSIKQILVYAAKSFFGIDITPNARTETQADTSNSTTAAVTGEGGVTPLATDHANSTTTTEPKGTEHRTHR